MQLAEHRGENNMARILFGLPQSLKSVSGAIKRRFTELEDRVSLRNFSMISDILWTIRLHWNAVFETLSLVLVCSIHLRSISPCLSQILNAKKIRRTIYQYLKSSQFRFRTVKSLSFVHSLFKYLGSNRSKWSSQFMSAANMFFDNFASYSHP